MDRKLFKILLAQRGIAQYELAKELGWCHSKLSQIVNAYRDVYPDEVGAICKALNANAVKLFPESTNGKSKTKLHNKARHQRTNNNRAEIAF